MGHSLGGNKGNDSVSAVGAFRLGMDMEEPEEGFGLSVCRCWWVIVMNIAGEIATRNAASSSHARLVLVLVLVRLVRLVLVLDNCHCHYARQSGATLNGA